MPTSKNIHRVIYKIENHFTGAVYIGMDKYYPNRFYTHKSTLRNNKHINKFLQEDFNKYGEDGFSFELVEDFGKSLTDEELSDWEIYYNIKYNSYNWGYNLTKGGIKECGRIFPKETRDKISESNFGRKNTDQQIKNIQEGVKFLRKKVYVFDLNTKNLIAEFESVKDYAKAYKLKYATAKNRIRLKCIPNNILATYKPTI